MSAPGPPPHQPPHGPAYQPAYQPGGQPALVAARPDMATEPPSWPAGSATARPSRRTRRTQLAEAFPRADLLGAAGVLCVVALLGLPLAWIWSRLAPPQLSLVQADHTLVALPPESQHRFDGLAIFVLLGVAAGVISAVAVWMIRRRRGPIALLALAAGSLVAAWLAMRTGVSLADGRYADAVRAAAPNAVVAAAPRLESAWVLIAQPLAAALAYGVATAINGLDDLGRHPTRATRAAAPADDVESPQ